MPQNSHNMLYIYVFVHESRNEVNTDSSLIQPNKQTNKISKRELNLRFISFNFPQKN